MTLDPQHILSDRPLAKSEQIALDHFRKNPNGRGFFSVAEIMAKHQDFAEAIQLLTLGLERHPSYSVARVYLTQLLLKEGHIDKALATLNASPLPLRGNLTAQIVRLKLVLLLGRRDEVFDLIREIGHEEGSDADFPMILSQLEIKPFEEVRKDFAASMKVALDTRPPVENLSVEAPLPEKARAPEVYLKAKAPSDLEAESSFRERVAKGFFASSVQSLFQKPTSISAPNENDLDRLTWARLLRRQGLYHKAAEIYQRLVLEAPQNELIRREYTEICDLRETQKVIDQKRNPEAVLALEKVRKIDDKLRLYNDLLSLLDRQHHELS